MVGKVGREMSRRQGPLSIDLSDQPLGYGNVDASGASAPGSTSSLNRFHLHGMLHRLEALPEGVFHEVPVSASESGTGGARSRRNWRVMMP